MTHERAVHALSMIDPASLSYPDWLAAGMALHHEGGTANEWDEWSRRDSRYVEGDCQRRWKGFKAGSSGVTMGTLVALAKKQGANVSALFDEGDYDGKTHFGFDEPLIMPRRSTTSKAPAEVAPPTKKLIDEHYLVADTPLPAPSPTWKTKDFQRYLELMFEPDELVGIVADSWEKDGKRLPQKGVWDRTAGRLIELLKKNGGNVAKVIGDTEDEVGAWIRINPLDGNGVTDENVTSYRHALLESDEGELSKQYAVIKALQIPCTCIVHSGGKSIHALVRVDAPDYETYKKRVAFLFDVWKREGLSIDSGNRNPSRLSRLPGVTRNGKEQYIIAEKSGKATWKDWEEYIIEANDNLPDPVELPYDLDKIPPLADELIEGVLRTGRKLMFSGPSKAGKSAGMQGLTAAVANGGAWLGNRVKKGKVLYLNCEIEENEFSLRMNQVYRQLGYDPDNYSNIRVWNLVGLNIPLDKLAPKLIRRVKNTGIDLIVIDPIYKVMVGDENDAQDVGNFCNLLDIIKKQTGAAVVYAHHHSKGAQGGKKSADRSSGSGVFSRDADAIADMVELEIDTPRREQIDNKMVCRALNAYAAAKGIGLDQIDELDRNVTMTFKERLEAVLPRSAAEIAGIVAKAHERAKDATGWRVEYTLRSFRPKQPNRVMYAYPLHVEDADQLLEDAKAAGELPTWQDKMKTKEKKKAQKPTKDERFGEFNDARSVSNDDLTTAAVEAFFNAEPVHNKRTVAALYDGGFLDGNINSLKAARKRLENSSKYRLDSKGKIVSKNAPVKA